MSRSVAVGSREFVEEIQGALNSRANGRRLESFSAADAGFVLRESSATYSPILAAEKPAEGQILMTLDWSDPDGFYQQPVDR